MIKQTTLIVLLLLSSLLNAQDLSNFNLEAHYSFSANGEDVTNNYSDAVTLNVSYSNGGIYSNGIYFGFDPNGTLIVTPNITGFDLDGFAIQIDVRPEEHDRNLFVGGDFWRWLTIQSSPTGKLEFLMNNGSVLIDSSNVAITLNQWQTISVVYTQSNSKFDAYLNGVLLFSKNLTHSFVSQDDFTFTCQDASSGENFKGNWRNLKLYNSGPVGFQHTQEDPSIRVGHSLDSNTIIVQGDQLLGSNFQVLDIQGRTVDSGQFKSNPALIKTKYRQSGSYLLVITDRKFTTIKKIVSINL